MEICFGQGLLPDDVCAIFGSALALGAAARWPEEIAAAIANQNTATWLSALGGAAVGGIISYVIARQGSRETLQRDKAARLDVEHASSLRATVVAMQITNRFYTLLRELRAAKAAAQEQDAEPWTFLRSSTGHTVQPERFQASDFVPFIKAKHSDIVHRASLAQEKLSAIEAAMRIYSQKRSEFQSFAAPYTVIGEGGISIVRIEDLQVKRTATLKRVELSSLFDQMLESAGTHYDYAAKLCTDMNTAHQSYFGGAAGFVFGVAELDEVGGVDTTQRPAGPADTIATMQR